MPTLPINWINALRRGGDRYGPELHVDANAASDSNGNEADAITGWSPTGLNGVGGNVFESQSAIKHTGDYAFHLESNDTPTASARIDKTFTVEVGSTYQINFWSRHVGTGGEWMVQIEGVDVTKIVSTDLIFTKTTYEYLATDVACFVRIRELDGSNDGGCYMDDFSLKKKLT